MLVSSLRGLEPRRANDLAFPAKMCFAELILAWKGACGEKWVRFPPPGSDSFVRSVKTVTNDIVGSA